MEPVEKWFAVHDTVILMTATVAPNGMGYTALQCPDIRKSQYLEAIAFYLRETPYDIVFCENTGVNLFDEVDSPEKYARLECLTFNGNDYDPLRGKSYGEARIIQYAICNSERLRSACSVIKITGRVKILNLDRLSVVLSGYLSSDFVTALEFSNRDWARSVCFYAPKEWLLNTVEKYGERLSDTDYNFEKMMSASIVETKGLKICRFHPMIEGVCGFSGQPYPRIDMPQRKLNHFDALCHVYRSRNECLNGMIAGLCWLYHVVERKIYYYCKR